ncbi:MAG: ankyrin repeat domain-containing protein [Phycisphaerae bacterium]|nr:ankyrin repeat domain-containing protein [Phycisphaerae bacterium]
MRLRFRAALLIWLMAAVSLFSEAAQQSFQDMITAGDVDGVRQMLKNNPEYANATIERTVKARDKYSISVLCFALQCRQPGIAQILLEAGADPTKNIDRRSPLAYTALEGYTELIPLLIQKGDDPNLGNGKINSGRSPLAYAKNVQTAQTLLDHGAGVNARNDKNEVPLHFRAAYGDIDVAALLIEHGADLNAKDDRGCTPLHVASLECLTEKVRLLIDKGADVNAHNNKDQNPLRYTIEERVDRRCGLERPGFYQTLGLLISSGADADAGDIVFAGDLERLKEYVRAEPDIIHTYRFRREPLLIIAIKEGHAEIVEYLIENGADVHTVGRFKNHGLHLAAFAGNPKTVELLLAAGLDVNALGIHGELPLHWVSKLPNADPYQRQCHYDEVTRVLLDAGLQLNTGARQAWIGIGCGVEGDEPIDQVSFYLRNLEARRTNEQVQLMAPPDLAFDVGDTPLHSAARWGRLSIVEMLIEAGAAVDCTNALNQTPLHYAVVYQHPEVVKALLAAGADPSIKTNKNMDAYQFAEIIADPEMLSLLPAKEK